MDVDQVEVDVRSSVSEPQAQAARTRPRWRGSAMWLFACLAGGLILIAALLAWGHWEFGSFSNTLAYLNGRRLLAEPNVLSFGTAQHGEERILHVTIQNRTGKAIKILGARSTCGCMGVEEQFPIAIAASGKRELTIHVWATGKDSAFEGHIDYYTDDETDPAVAVLIRGAITD